MAAVTWNAINGNWFVAANWDEPNPTPPPPLLHQVPGAGDDVSILNNGTTGVSFTVTYNGNSTINTLAGSGDGILNIVAGSLTLANGGVANQMGINVAAGATLNVAANTLQLTSGTFAGTLDGNGQILFRGGTFNLNAGVAVDVASLVLGVASNGTVSTTNLNTNLLYTEQFTLADLSGNHAVLNLNNHILTLAGTANIDGTVVGPGTLRITGDAVHGSSGFGAPIVRGGATLEYRNGSTGVQHLNMTLGDATTDGTLRILAGGLYTIDTTTSINPVDIAHAFVINSGTFRAIGAGVTATVNANFSTNGTVTVGNGATLALAGGGDNLLRGTIQGAGTFVAGAGETTIDSATVTVARFQMNGGNAGADLHLASNFNYGGEFSFANQFDRIFLEGFNMVLTGTGNTLFNNIVEGDNGRLRITGDATIGGNVNLGGTTDLSLENAGTLLQNGSVMLSGTLTNNAGRTYKIVSAGNINNGGATVVNNGTFTDAAAGMSIVSADFTNNGKLAVANGAQLVLSDGTQTINGTVSGAGTLTFGFGADATLNPTSLTIANITLAGGNGGADVSLGADLTYAGRLSFANSFDRILLGVHDLTLTGTGNSFLGNTINGAGTMRIEGTATIGGNLALQLAAFENAGTVNQNGNFSLNGAVTNEAGATWRMITTAGVIFDGASGSFENDGTLLVNAAGLNTLGVSFVNDGTVTVASGATLRLGAGGALNGTIGGAGTLNVGGGTVNLNTVIGTSAFSLTGGTVLLTLDLAYAGAFTFANGFANFDLDGHHLNLSGPTTFTSGVFRGDLGFADQLTVSGSAIDLSNLVFADWTAGQDKIALNGTSGADSITGSGQADSVTGGNGSDTITGGLGNDTMEGGNGDDTYAGVTAGDTVTEAAGAAAGQHDLIQAGATFSLAAYANVEDLTLTGAGNTDGTGNAAANIITGNDSDNTLDGAAGADTLRGGGGDDIYINPLGDTIEEGAGAGTDTVRSNATFTLAAIANVENLTLTGGAAANGTGNSLDNLIVGNSARNVLNGATGADTINGGTGNDLIVGGAGNDRMNGGADADTFRFAVSNTGTDTILGFSTALDRFDLAGGTFSNLQEVGGNSRLTHAGGLIIIDGVTGLTIEQWNALILPAGGSTSADDPLPSAAEAASIAMPDLTSLAAIAPSNLTFPIHADYFG